MGGEHHRAEDQRAVLNGILVDFRKRNKNQDYRRRSVIGISLFAHDFRVHPYKTPDKFRGLDCHNERRLEIFPVGAYVPASSTVCNSSSVICSALYFLILLRPFIASKTAFSIIILFIEKLF